MRAFPLNHLPKWNHEGSSHFSENQSVIRFTFMVSKGCPNARPAHPENFQRKLLGHDKLAFMYRLGPLNRIRKGIIQSDLPNVLLLSINVAWGCVGSKPMTERF